MRRLALLILCPLAFALAQYDHFHPDSNISATGIQAVGACKAVFVDSNYAFITNGGSLEILNITVPGSPSRTGSTITPYIAENIFVDGNTLYMADRSNFLRTYDITNRSFPQESWSIETDNPTYFVTVRDTLAFVSTYYALKIYNIANPEQPEVVSEFPTNALLYISLDSVYAYLADGHAGIVRLDISDPSSPKKMASVQTEHWAWGTAVVGDYLYVADATKGLKTYSTSTPDTLLLVDSYDTPGYSYRVAAVENKLYLCDGPNGGIQVFDISSPSNPSLAGNFNSLGRAQNIAMYGQYAFLADGDYGCQVVNFSNPASPVWEHRYLTGGRAVAVHAEGDYAFVAADDEGYRIIDATSPSFPKLLRSFRSQGRASDIFVQNGYAYITESSYLSIYDVSVPTAYNFVGKVSLSNAGNPSRVAVQDNHAYVIAGQDLAIVNVSNPQAPSHVATVGDIGPGRDVSVQGDYAYVANSTSLVIVDVSTPSAPDTVTIFENEGYNRSVHVNGNYAYLGTSQHGLSIVDISDPANPQQKGVFDEGVTAEKIFAHGDFALLACGVDGLIAVDIRNPSNPQKAGFYDTPYYLYDVFATSEYIYLADGNYGMLILDNAIPTSIDGSKNRQPVALKLAQNYPNPFNPITTIQYEITDAGPAKIDIFDISGRRVATLVDAFHTPGIYSTRLDAGRFSLSSGVYFFRLETSRGILQKRMVLLK